MFIVYNAQTPLSVKEAVEAIESTCSPRNRLTSWAKPDTPFEGVVAHLGAPGLITYC